MVAFQGKSAHISLLQNVINVVTIIFPTIPLFLLQSDCRFWIAVTDKIPLFIYYKKPTVMKMKKAVDGRKMASKIWKFLFKNGLRTNFDARECELRNAPENMNKFIESFILLIKKKEEKMRLFVYVASQYWCKEDSVLELLGSVSLYYCFSHS